MRIGIDFDNTIICYDDVFSHLAKLQQLVPTDYTGSKHDLRERVRASAEGDIAWQRLQGKAYGEFVKFAKMFNGVREFMTLCQAKETVELFIVSHKTQLGHFDEKQINLRDAARAWMRAQGFFAGELPLIPEKNLYFESTRDEKIKRIRSLQCTHFIDDLPEVLYDDKFPKEIKGYLFAPDGAHQNAFTNWVEITNAIFPS
jgi:hypothetical protein